MVTNIKSYPNLIDCTWKTLSDTLLEDHNPADYNEIIGLFPIATLDDTKSAIRAAHSAFPAWSRTPAPARGAILDKASQILTSRLDEIGTVLTREEGKTLTEAKGEVARARDISNTMRVKAGVMADKPYPVPSMTNCCTRAASLSVWSASSRHGIFPLPSPHGRLPQR